MTLRFAPSLSMLWAGLPPGRPAGEDSVRIAIADDSALFRTGLVLLLEASGVRVTTQATSGTELIARLFPPGPGRTPPGHIDIHNGRTRTPRPDAVSGQPAGDLPRAVLHRCRLPL